MDTPSSVLEAEVPEQEIIVRDPLTQLALSFASAADRNAVLSELWVAVEPQVRTLARRMLGNDADADDAVQEVALILVRKLDSFGGSSQFSTWIHRVTVNAVLAKRQKRGRTDARYEQMPLEGTCDPNSINDAEDAEEARHRVGQAMAALSETAREAIRLAYIDDIPNTAAADAMGIGVGAYKSYLHRGKGAMRDYLKPREADMGIWERPSKREKAHAAAKLVAAEAGVTEPVAAEAPAVEPALLEVAMVEPDSADAAQSDDTVELLVRYEVQQQTAGGGLTVGLEVRRAEAQRLLAELLRATADTAA